MCSEHEDQVRFLLGSLEGYYFEDFTFEECGLANQYFCAGDVEIYISVDNIKIEVSEEYDLGGFDSNTGKLCINPEYIQDERVLLHEMIHVYENIYRKTIPELSNILTIQLYKKLSAIHPDLDNYLAHFLNRNTFQEIEDVGGVHGALFALKALDIDDRKGWNPGTTFGYIPYVPEE